MKINTQNSRSPKELKAQITLLEEIKSRLEQFMESYEQSEDDEKIRLIQDFEKEVQTA